MTILVASTRIVWRHESIGILLTNSKCSRYYSPLVRSNFYGDKFIVLSTYLLNMSDCRTRISLDKFKERFINVSMTICVFISTRLYIRTKTWLSSQHVRCISSRYGFDICKQMIRSYKFSFPAVVAIIFYCLSTINDDCMRMPSLSINIIGSIPWISHIDEHDVRANVLKKNAEILNVCITERIERWSFIRQLSTMCFVRQITWCRQCENIWYMSLIYRLNSDSSESLLIDERVSNEWHIW
jgi:hypothetical protein